MNSIINNLTISIKVTIALIQNPKKISLIIQIIKIIVFIKILKQKTISIQGFTIQSSNHKYILYTFIEVFIFELYRLPDHHQRVIDIGSHIGMSILYMKKQAPDVHILCFEPESTSHNDLLANINQNNLHNIVVVNCAVSNHENDSTLYVSNSSPADTHSNILIRKDIIPHDTIIKTVRLSNYINEPIDFIKIDIEGSEFDVIAELITSQKISLIKNITIETHAFIQGYEKKMNNCLKQLAEAGFKCQRYKPPFYFLDKNEMIYATNMTTLS